MFQGLFADQIIEEWIDQLEDRDKYLAAFSSDPLAVPDFATVEVIGGSYARQAGVWTRTSIRALTLDEGIAFRSLPPGTVIAAVGVVDDAFAGSLIARSLRVDEAGDPDPLVLVAGGTWTVSAGEYVLGLDVPTA